MAFGTASKDGIPNVVAIGSKKVVGDNKIWIIDTYFKKTKRNLMENNKVSITMWQGSEGYQLKGEADYYSSGKLFNRAKKWILELKPGKKVKGVVEIKVTAIYSITPNPKEAGRRIKF